MAHNLDIEISALRKGWGEWCEDYIRLQTALQEIIDQASTGVGMTRIIHLATEALKPADGEAK